MECLCKVTIPSQSINSTHHQFIMLFNNLTNLKKRSIHDIFSFLEEFFYTLSLLCKNENLKIKKIIIFQY